MINLRALYVEGIGEKTSEHLALSEKNDKLLDAETINKYESIQWLKDRLPSTYCIVTNPDLVGDISIWID